MLILLAAAVILLCLLLSFTALIQLLCVEVLRVRPRQQRVVEFLRETLLIRLGIEAEEGARAFSFHKQVTLILLSLTLFLLVAAAVSGPDAASAISTRTVWIQALAAALVAALVFSYAVPQLMYRRSWIAWLGAVSFLVSGGVLLLRPFTFLRQFFESLTQFDHEDKKATDSAASSEEIEALIAAGVKGGLFERDDRRLIESVVAFNDKTLREVMTPRPFVVYIDASKSLQDLAQLFQEQHFSRYPVCRDTLDEVVGFVHIVDLLMEPQENWRLVKVREKMRPVEYVPESKRIHDELRDMQKDRAHLSVVVDEYGQTSGLVTMEDLLEEIFGEIQDELEVDDVVVEDLDDGSSIMRGSTDIDLLRSRFEFELDPETESTTVGGLVTEWAGYVPARGEGVSKNDLKIEVLESNKRQVIKVKVSGKRIKTKDGEEQQA